MEKRIEKRIAELTAARDAYVVEANQKIAAYNGAIGELSALLTVEEEKLPEPDSPAPEVVK
jgi:hypothetical protein